MSTLDDLWGALWEDLLKNAHGRVTGAAIIATHRPDIEAEVRRLDDLQELVIDSMGIIPGLSQAAAVVKVAGVTRGEVRRVLKVLRGMGIEPIAPLATHDSDGGDRGG